MITHLNKILPTFLFTCIILSPTYAAQWDLSYGVNNMSVKGARPLEQAPNGSTSYTPGVQFAFHGKSDETSAIQQTGYFKFLIDWDQDELDPDHIPVWFIGEYKAKAKLFSITKNSSLNMLFDADYKANSVSSVERAVKLFAGVSTEYDTEKFYAGIKASFGRYMLEIDDDVPKTRGYGREDLKNIEYTYSLEADTEFKLSDFFKLKLLAQTWQSSDEWLENQYKVELIYDSNKWVEDSTFVVSFWHTQYNIDVYQRDDTTLAILPWNKDTLFQAYIIVPWDI